MIGASVLGFILGLSLCSRLAKNARKNSYILDKNSVHVVSGGITLNDYAKPVLTHGLDEVIVVLTKLGKPQKKFPF